MSNIPEGYKQTEVGVIPEEWEVKELGDCLLKKPEYGINAPAVPYSDNLPVYLRITDISDDGRFLSENRTSVNNISSYKYLLEKDDVVFARTGASTGKTYLNNPKDGELVFAGFLIRVKVNPNELIAQYLKSYTETANYWNWVRIMSMRSGQPGINGNEYAQLKIPLPPLPEQQAIASTLSDVDTLITALEHLITKKRNIKQGAMQQLLTGKKRLPGFSGEWEVKKLGEIAEIATGNTPPTNDLNNYGDEFLFVSPADLGRRKYIIDTEKKLSKKGYNISRKFPKNSILFTCIGSTIGKSGITPIGLTSNQQINAIFANDSYSTDYVYYILNLLAYKIKSSASEQAVPIINKSTFEHTQIPFPPLPEQQAIAQILSDMDTEIETLEQKRNKYKTIKKGMMQELLTGKTRLLCQQ